MKSLTFVFVLCIIHTQPSYGHVTNMQDHNDPANNRTLIQKHKFLHYRRVNPPKRDFQDHNPPRTADELYARYDPSTAISTGVILGGLLGFIVGRVLIRVTTRYVKRKLRRTKRFSKYFPERELPPLHIAQQIAREHGVVLPESLINKLIRCGPEANLKRIADAVKSPAAVTAAAISPLIVQEHCAITDSPSASELLGLIRVNIIGATPSITPNTSRKILPSFPQSFSAEIEKTPPPSGHRKLRNGDSNGHLNGKDEGNNVMVTTTAVIESQPLLFNTTANTSGGEKSPSSTNSSISISVDTQIASVHKKPCLSNGDALVNPSTSGSGFT